MTAKNPEFKVFTPFAFKGTWMRAYMLLDEADHARVSGEWESAVVIDRVTGRTFQVERSACGARCRCAAVVIREMTERGVLPGYVEEGSGPESEANASQDRWRALAPKL